MKMSNLSSLEETIDNWINKLAEEEKNEYEGYYCTELPSLMAQAAALVLMHSFLDKILLMNNKAPNYLLNNMQLKCRKNNSS